MRLCLALLVVATLPVWAAGTFTLSTLPPGPSVVGRRVVLLSEVSGVVSPRYRFEVRDAEGRLAYVRDWTTGRSTWWYPDVPGTYTATALVRSGSAGAPLEQTLSYTINAPLSAVSVQVTAPAPTLTGVPVTFVATPTGGGTVECRPLIGFRTSVRNPITWDQTRPWGSAQSWTFTPETAGYYYLRVYAREDGSTRYFDVSSTDVALTLRYPPVTDFVVACDPPSGGMLASTITITASDPVGGHTLEWKFWARQRSSSLWVLIRDYAPSPTVVWTPALPGAHDVMVYAREVGKTTHYDLSRTRTYTVAPLQQVNPTDGSVLVFVPAGEFLMGTPDDATYRHGEDEHPQRRVYLDGYWIMRDEVTVAQYQAFCAATGRAMPTRPQFIINDKAVAYWSELASYPMVNVTWDDATAYAAWAGLALPTEAQWEKAARGPDGRLFPWGNQWDSAKCSVEANSWTFSHIGPWPVDKYPAGASPYGCRNMVGNASEWCADWYGPYPGIAAPNPTGPREGLERVVRSSSWNMYGTRDFTYSTRTSHRNSCGPDVSSESRGFRCVLHGSAL